MIGEIKVWNEEEGYGFINVKQRRKDVFCHSFDVKGAYDLARARILPKERSYLSPQGYLDHQHLMYLCKI